MLMFSSLKQVIHTQTRQYGYQTVPFGVYIYNVTFSIVMSVVSPLLVNTSCIGPSNTSYLCHVM